MPYLIYLKTLKGGITAQCWYDLSPVYCQIGTNMDGTPRYGQFAELFLCKRIITEDEAKLGIDDLVKLYPFAVVQQEPNATLHLFAGTRWLVLRTKRSG